MSVSQRFVTALLFLATATASASQVADFAARAETLDVSADLHVRQAQVVEELRDADRVQVLPGVGQPKSDIYSGQVF